MNLRTAIIIVVVALADLASANNLDALKATYESRLNDLAQAHDKRMAELGEQYVLSLDKLLAEAKKAGNLDLTVELLNELKHFQQENTVPSISPDHAALQAAQLTYRERASTLEFNNAKSIVALTSKYDQALEKLQKGLVTTSDLDGARAVKQERNRVAESPRVASSREILARRLPKQGGSAPQPTTSAPSQSALFVDLLLNRTFTLKFEGTPYGLITFNEDGKTTGVWENRYEVKQGKLYLYSPDEKYITAFDRKGSQWYGKRATESPVQDGFKFQLQEKK